MRFIDPRTDFAFKKIFGSEQSKSILISFLNALVYQGQSKIKNLEIIDPYQQAQLLGLKDTYLDVKAVLDDDTTVIIEMQYLYLEGFEKRILYNGAKRYANQLVRGQRYYELNPVIALTITKFQLFDAFPDVISYFEFKERYHLIDYPDGDIQMIFVELAKFKKELADLMDITDKWIYFMKNAGSLEMVPENLGDITEIKQAFDIANEATFSIDELDKVLNQQFYLQDQERLKEKAEKAAQTEQQLEQTEQQLEEAEQKLEEAEQKAAQAEQKLEEAEQQLQTEIEGKKSLLLRPLSKIFGEISPEIQAKINNLSNEQLASLSEIFLDFKNISNLIDWLA